VYRAIDRAAATRARVLIVGESGTGKEMVAAAIHRLSRVPGPLVAVNCAAIPETLIESELFGHVAGAFTGAVRAHRGSLEQAHQGTLFLDEVGDMTLMTQAKVLRALETRTFRAVGAEEVAKSDFRLVAATHRDLREEVEKGNFREDLYYRLGVVTIAVPPLRERREDIGELAGHFLAQQRERHGLAAAALTPAALAALAQYAWPGNIRQLANVIERLSVLSPGPQIDSRDVRAALSVDAPAENPQPAETLRDARTQFERDFIATTLATHAWRIQETAEALGINRSHLWKKIRTLRIPEPG
jgi:two-component system nitrogen regulation response regulator NtrX